MSWILYEAVRGTDPTEPVTWHSHGEYPDEVAAGAAGLVRARTSDGFVVVPAGVSLRRLADAPPDDPPAIWRVWGVSGMAGTPAQLISSGHRSYAVALLSVLELRPVRVVIRSGSTTPDGAVPPSLLLK